MNREISNKQISRIINLDESCLSLDGSEWCWEGRPSSRLFNTKLPECRKPVSKSSVIMTFIDGSNAVGEAYFHILTIYKGNRKRKREDQDGDSNILS